MHDLQILREHLVFHQIEYLGNGFGRLSYHCQHSLSVFESVEGICIVGKGSWQLLSWKVLSKFFGLNVILLSWKDLSNLELSNFSIFPTSHIPSRESSFHQNDTKFSEIAEIGPFQKLLIASILEKRPLFNFA